MMFEHWDSYYLLIGTAAGALIGLLFVVATLNAGREVSDVTRGTKTYLTPTVFHFAIVVVVSALATAPGLPARTVGLLLGACAIVGLVYSAWICIRLRSGNMTGQHWSDFWYFGVAPTAIYLGLGATSGTAWAAPSALPYGTGVLLLLLMLVGIRNAWDLVTWLAPRTKR
jgi:hypothetical protein